MLRKFSAINGSIPVLAFAVLLVVTYFSYGFVEHEIDVRKRATYQSGAIVVADNIAERLSLYEQVLWGARGFVVSAPTLDRVAFHSYVEGLNLESTYPGIQGVGYAVVVPPDQLDAHIRAVRAEGFPSYTVKPQGQRSSYTAIIYLEPLSGRNLRAFGYDMYSEASRHEAMDRARDTDDVAMSSRVTLVQEDNQDIQYGFLIYVPVYRNGAPHQTLQERRDNLVGWTYAPFRIGDLMHGIFGERPNGYDLEVFDGTDPSPGALMFSTVKGTKPASEFVLDRTIEIAGRPWTFRLSTAPELEKKVRQDAPVVVAVTGILLSILLSFIIWLFLTGRQRAVALADALTVNLRQSNHDLEMESRKNLVILRNASDGIHIMDDSGTVVEASDSFCTMLGYTRDEVIGMHASVWDAKFDSVGLKTHLASQFLSVDREQFETVHRRKDGSQFTVEVSSFAFELDGKPMLFNSSRDIDARKMAESLRQKAERDAKALAARLNLVLATAAEGILGLDDELRVTFANPAAVELLGWLEEKDMHGLRAWDATGHAMADGSPCIDGDCHINRALLDQTTCRIDDEFFVHRSKGLFPVEYVASALIVNDVAVGVVVVFRDITERKTFEDRLIEANRELEQFAYVASHDLRQPLRAINSYLTLIQSEIGPSLTPDRAAILTLSCMAPSIWTD